MPETPDHPFTVGQTVVIHRWANQRAKPERQVVRKVGRTLVHVSTGFADETASYRLDTRMRNDGYGHSGVYTEPEWEERSAKDYLRTELIKIGWIAPLGTSSSKLRRILDILKETPA